MGPTNIRSRQIKDDDLLVDDLRDFAVVQRTTTLVVDVYAGRLRSDNVVTVVSAQTVTVADDATSYVEIDSAGAATSNTSGFTSGRIPLATVVSSGGNVTTVTDKRAWHEFSSSSSSGMTIGQALTLFNGPLIL